MFVLINFLVNWNTLQVESTHVLVFDHDGGSPVPLTKSWGEAGKDIESAQPLMAEVSRDPSTAVAEVAAQE